MTFAVAVRAQVGALALDVAFEGPGDGVTVLFGPSGAGKSATLAAIAGTLPVSAAAVRVGDAVLGDSARGIALPPERRRIGLVHQDALLFPHLTVERNLLYGWRRAPAPRAIGMERVLAALGIAPLLHRRPATLSGGERQRVAIGRALLSQPRLLLLDEPVSALDLARRDEVLTLIEEVGRRFALPMLYVTHSREEARRLGRHLVRIEAGRVVAAGTPAAVLGDAGVTGVIVGHDRDVAFVRIGETVISVPGLSRPIGARVRIG